MPKRFSPQHQRRAFASMRQLPTKPELSAVRSGFAHVVPLPPHTPHASTVLPLFGTPSQPAHELPLPPHPPQAPTFFPLFGTPSQPAHELPLPPHTPQASTFFPLPATPSHPAHVLPVPPQTPQMSMDALQPNCAVTDLLPLMVGAQVD